ncbi:MAG: response regulator transcription factor [Beijerinckiaceae bacterium]
MKSFVVAAWDAPATSKPPRRPANGRRLNLKSTRAADASNDDRRHAAVPSSIIVIDERVLYRDCFARCLAAACRNHVVISFPSVRAWQNGKDAYPAAAVVVLCAQGRRWSGPELAQDVASLTGDESGSPVVVVADGDDMDHVLDVISRGVRGYIPTSLPLDVAVEAVRLVQAGGTFIPASTLTSGRGFADSAKASGAHEAGAFTARQILVVQALHSGKANKQIAHDLNMRESTVKAHIRNIMRKLKAKNRTEVAVLTRDLVEHSKAW